MNSSLTLCSYSISTKLKNMNIKYCLVLMTGRIKNDSSQSSSQLGTQNTFTLTQEAQSLHPTEA